MVSGLNFQEFTSLLGLLLCYNVNIFVYICGLSEESQTLMDLPSPIIQCFHVQTQTLMDGGQVQPCPTLCP